MLGSTLALLNHSLQLDARLLRHHVCRAVFVGFLYLFVVFATLQSLLMGAPGHWLFGWITYLNFWFISLAGISFFATVISEEKEAETLGLLRMAGISPTALLLGKSTSRLIAVGLLLSLQFPFTLLSITLGGVTAHQIGAVFLALLAYTAFVANLALFCSVVARTSSRASVCMTALLALFFFVPVIAESVAGSLGSGAAGLRQSLQDLLAPEYETSVFARLSVIMRTGFDQSPISFQVVSNLVLALLLFAVSRLLFDRVTRYHSVPPATRGLLIRPRGRLKWLGTGRVWSRALIWKDFHFVTGGWPLAALKLVGYGLLNLWVGLMTFWENPVNPWYRMAFWITGLMWFILLMEASVSAARIFRDEVRGNSLPSLMLLPARPSSIYYAKVAGCLAGLVPAALYLLLGVLMLIPAIIVETPRDLSYMAGMLIVIGYVTAVCFGLFFVHLVAYLSLTFPWGATPAAIGVSLVVSVLFSCFLSIGASVAYLAMTLLLHFLIATRLRQLGME